MRLTLKVVTESLANAAAHDATDFSEAHFTSTRDLRRRRPTNLGAAYANALTSACGHVCRPPSAAPSPTPTPAPTQMPTGIAQPPIRTPIVSPIPAPMATPTAVSWSACPCVVLLRTIAVSFHGRPLPFGPTSTITRLVACWQSRKSQGTHGMWTTRRGTDCLVHRHRRRKSPWMAMCWNPSTGVLCRAATLPDLAAVVTHPPADRGRFAVVPGEHTDGGTWRGAPIPPGQHRPATSPK